VCQQLAWAYSDEEKGQFVIVQFRYINEGQEDLSDLYSAVFADFDIGDSSDNDNAKVDMSKKMAWMYDEMEGGVYVGVVLLTDLGCVISTINNEDHIYPNAGITDTDQLKFMKGELMFGDQTRGDYSVVVSGGPFNLGKGKSYAVAFAFVGGRSEEELMTNRDKVVEVYEEVGVEEYVKGEELRKTLEVFPSVGRGRIGVMFSLSHSTEVTLGVYDIAGRLVETLKKGYVEKGNHKVECENMEAGVYFVRMKVGRESITKKVIVVR